MSALIYKICPETLWRAAEKAGRFDGASIDLADGYMHFSTAGQVRETAARYFAGEKGLVLVAVDRDRLGEALRWEPSRGGELFPHLYGPLDLSAVQSVEPLPVKPGGGHVFPADLA